MMVPSYRPAITEEQEIRVWVIENDAQGIPRATREPDVAYLSLEEILCKPSAGLLARVGAADTTAEATVSLLMLTIEPGKTVATHTGPPSNIVYILQGEGKLTLNGGEPLDYQPNDCFILKPETLHGWENGDEVTAMLCVEVP